MINSVSDIWETVIDRLREKKNVTNTAITTWFDDCEPVDVSDNRMVICTPNDFKRGMIQQRFAEDIKALLSDLFSAEMDLLILTDDELEDYNSEKESKKLMPEFSEYTFENFIVGPSNRAAHGAAIGASENLGSTLYNPLFIYGKSGLGKTHLMFAIAHHVAEKEPDKRIVYVKAVDFTDQMVSALQSGRIADFRQKYRDADLFLIDDIQFISGKQQTQEEFFHTFNAHYEAGHQIVITSDRPPIEISKLEDRLRSRFEGSMMQDIQPPDLETRMAIIRSKAAKLGMVLSDEVVVYIAENITSNVRQIEGVVKRLTSYYQIENDTINVDSVKRAIKDVIRSGTYIPTPDIIIEETARFFSLTSDDLRGQRKNKNIALARHISIYLIRNLTTLTLTEIGAQFQDRNHATVLSSLHKIEDLLKTDPDMPGTIRDISSNINSRN